MFTNRAWDLIESFYDFNLISLPRNQNKHVDKLAIMESKFDIPKEVKIIEIQQFVKVVVRSSILDNEVTFQVFESDEHILKLLMEEVKFSKGNQKKLE